MISIAYPNPHNNQILVARARIADAQRHSLDAIALQTEAAAKEDNLAYDEPSDWFFPVRHMLGDALLRAGKAQEAENVYREDLRRHRRRAPRGAKKQYRTQREGKRNRGRDQWQQS